MVIKSSLKKNIKRLCQEVELKGYSIDKAILFGSTIRGKKKPNDIDIALFSKAFGKDRIDEMMLLNKIATKIDVNLELHPFHTSDINEKYSTLIAEIKKGQVLKFV